MFRKKILSSGFVLLVTLSVAGVATAGNISKKFADKAPPPPQTVKKDFNHSRGQLYQFDSPKPSLTPSGAPRTSNATPSVAVPLNKPFSSVGKIK